MNISTNIALWPRLRRALHTEVLVTSATSRSVLIPPPKTTIFKDGSSFQREIDISNKIPQLRREYKKKAADRINDLKEFPKKLIYVSNFPDAIRPQKEFIPHVKENIITVSWKQLPFWCTSCFLNLFFLLPASSTA